MHKITDLEFRRFSAKHHNASRNWLIPIIKTNDPEIFGIGDASSLGEDEIIIEETKYLFEIKHEYQKLYLSDCFLNFLK